MQVSFVLTARVFALTARLFALTAKNLALTARVRYLWINRDLNAGS